MKPRLLFLVGALCLLIGASLRAQTLTQLRDTGPRDNRINIVFLAEGYTASEEEKFIADARVKLSVLLGDESLSRFAAVANGFAIYVASAESGADDPAGNITRDTYFNSSFGCGGIDRLLAMTPLGTERATALLRQFVPEYDIVILLVNTTKFGGSGGSITITSLSLDSNDTVIHELAHSFALLSDEYVDEQVAGQGPNPTIEKINVTQQTIRERIVWRDYIPLTTALPTPEDTPDSNKVGLFEGAYYRPIGYYRPTSDSKMHSLGARFGPVNLQAFAAAVHSLNLNLATSAPVIVEQPVGGIVNAGQNHTLRVTAQGTGPLTYQWRHNGVYVPDALGAELAISSMNAAVSGNYRVEVTNAKGTVVSTEVSVLLPGQATPPLITSDLSSTAIVPIGRDFSLSVQAGGTGPFTYQWRKDGVNIAGATSDSLNLNSVQSTDNGLYSVIVSNGAGSILSNVQTLSIFAQTPTITQNPMNQIAKVGDTVTFMVIGNGSAPLAYQWRKNNVDIANANAASYTLGKISLTDAGSYNCIVSNGVGRVTSGVGVLTVSNARLTSLSVRSGTGTGEQTLILGFAIKGSGQKQVLCRGVGPTLTNFSVPGVLADPRLELYRAGENAPFQQNDDWDGSSALANAFAAVGAFALPAYSKDAALCMVLPSGLFTAQVKCAEGKNGIALAEAYDADSLIAPAYFVAFSARNYVGTGEGNLIAGFAITGNTTKTLLIRGIGPTLATFGVGGILVDPRLELYRLGTTTTLFCVNDNWTATTAMNSAVTATGAFALPAGSKDAAVLVTLSPGIYTANVNGVNGATGVALIEVYEVP